MEVILFFVLVYAAKRAWDDTVKGAAKSRKAYMKRAAKKHPGMSKRQASRHALRHDIGHALSQLFRGFPNARHGFASGWHEGRQAHAHARAEHQRAKAEHLETRASLIPDLTAYRARQKAALERIRGGAGPEVKASACSHAPGPCLFPYSCPCDCPDCMDAFGREWEPPEEGNGGSEGRQPTRRVDGRPETDSDRRFFNLRESGYDGPVDQDGRIPESAGAWGVGPDGSSVRLSDGYAEEARAIRDGFEYEDCEVCGRDLDAHVIAPDPLGHAHAYCAEEGSEGSEGGTSHHWPPANREQAERQAQASSRDGEGNSSPDQDLDLERALYRSDQARAQHTSPTEGTPMASEVTYDGVIKGSEEAVTAAEERAAEVARTITQAEGQVAEAGIAQRWADNAAEQMQALDVDSASLGAMADHQDALAAAEKALQGVLESLEQARQAQGRVIETAQNVESTLKHGHAGLAEAHKEAPVQAAERQFYGEG